MGTAVTIDEGGGDAYVAGYVASSSGDKSDDKVAVYKVRRVKPCVSGCTPSAVV